QHVFRLPARSPAAEPSRRVPCAAPPSEKRYSLCGAPHNAEFERDLIRARTGEGRERAKARGVKMGRPFKLTPHQQKEAIRRRDNGEPMRDIARSYNVSHSTISRLAM